VAERSFGSVGYSGDQYGIFWYVNDTWKLRPSLSLNLGVRYEYTSTPFGWTQQTLNSIANVPGLITFGSPQAPTKDFMPRVGFAYSPGNSGNTSIRGGFGLGYDVLYDNIGTLSRPPQIGSTVDCPHTCQAPFLANGGIPFQPSSGITVLDQADARAGTSAYLPNHVRYPYAESWNLGIQRVFAKDYTAELRYVGTRGLALPVQTRLNIQDVVTPGNSLPTFLQAPSQAQLDALPLTLGDLNTQFGNGGFLVPAYLNAGFNNNFLTSYQPWGASTYHGLQAQLSRRFNNGLQFQAAYTYSHTVDNSTADFHSTDITPRRPQDFLNLPAERGNSLLDHRHRFTLSTIYDVPWNKTSSSWLKRNLLGNYEIAPVFTWESGQWGTVQSGVDSNLNADAASDRAFLNPAGSGSVGSDVINLCNSNLPSGNLCNNDPNPNFDPSPFVVGYQAVNPNARYIISGPGTLPTSSRSNLTTPPINNWDLTVAKHIALTERYRIEFLVQALNAFNHPEFVTGSPNQALQIADVGSQRNYFIPNQPNFFNARQSFPSNARTLQLVLKFNF
jgi:hypothetical protein